MQLINKQELINMLERSGLLSEFILFKIENMNYIDVSKLRSKRKWLNEVSQFLQDSGFEEASKAIDCKYEL